MKTALSIPLIMAGLVPITWALPILQLDVTPGTYNTSTETTVATGNPFTLRALIDGTRIDLTRNFYISAAISPKVTTEDFGSFLVNGIEYSAALGNMQYGCPPVDDALKDLSGHGIFDTWYAEILFNAVGSSSIAAYNVQDGTSAPGYLKYVDFMVNIDGLESPPNNPYSVHFDLYSYDDAGNKIDYFAPFSHDAQSGGHGLIVHNVPDGGTTLLLLGAAMTCLGIGRRLRLKA